MPVIADLIKFIELLRSSRRLVFLLFVFSLLALFIPRLLPHGWIPMSVTLFYGRSLIWLLIASALSGLWLILSLVEKTFHRPLTMWRVRKLSEDQKEVLREFIAQNRHSAFLTA